MQFLYFRVEIIAKISNFEYKGSIYNFSTIFEMKNIINFNPTAVSIEVTMQ